MTVSDENGDDLLTTRDVAARMRVSEQTVRRWRYDGDLPFVRFGYRTVRFELGDVDDFVRRRRAQ